MIIQIPRRLNTSGFFTCATVVILSKVTCLAPFVLITPKRAFAGIEVNLSEAVRNISKELKIFYNKKSYRKLKKNAINAKSYT